MTSGGKREGAGRPCKSDKKKPLAIKIDPTIADYLATLPNKTAAIIYETKQIKLNVIPSKFHSTDSCLPRKYSHTGTMIAYMAAATTCN